MIRIRKGEENLVTLTLKEKATLIDPYYLFEFINDVTKTVVRFTTANESNYTRRYDRFTVTETSGTNYLTSGVITLSPTGFWSYKIFEQASATNLDPANAISMVESGKVIVTGDDAEFARYNNDNTFISYGTGSS